MLTLDSLNIHALTVEEITCCITIWTTSCFEVVLLWYNTTVTVAYIVQFLIQRHGNIAGFRCKTILTPLRSAEFSRRGGSLFHSGDLCIPYQVIKL